MSRIRLLVTTRKGAFVLPADTPLPEPILTANQP